MALGARTEMEQKTIVEDLYDPPAPVQTVATKKEAWKPDLIDQGYIQLRTIFPSWLILACGLIGAVTLVIIMFRKQVRGLIILWGRLLEDPKNKL